MAMRKVSSLALAIIVVGAVCLMHPSTGYTGTFGQEVSNFWHGWTLPVNVSQSPTNAATWPTLDVAQDGQMIYLAWSDRRETFQDIYYTLSIDGGKSWAISQPAVVTAESDSLRPSLVVSGTTPVIAWAEAKLGLSHATWQWALGKDVVQVPNTRDVLSSAPCLAWGTDGDLHIALQGGLGTQPDMLYSRREVGATGWPTATVVFTHTASGSYNPSLVVSDDGQMVHLVWEESVGAVESQVYYVRGQKSGQDVLWETPLSLSQGITRSVRPDIALWSDPAAEGAEAQPSLYVVWGEQVGGFDTQYVRYTYSGDGGTHWSAPLRVDARPVSANNVAPTYVTPALAVGPSGAVCAAWHGFRPDGVVEAEEVYVSCSTDHGASWGTPANVSRSPGVISIRPALAIGDDGILQLAWQELAGADPKANYQIYYAHSLPYRVLFPLVRR